MESWLVKSHKEHPVMRAMMAHYRFVSIHPFVDGNGRTARLFMNMILIQNGFPPAIIGPKDRLKYINSLEEAQLGGSLEPYLHLICKFVEHSLDLYLKSFSKVPQKTKISLNIKLMKIGELAKRSGESTATLRYWIKVGLLDVETTTESGYQLFAPEMLARISKIRNLQDKRLSLEEILEKIRH